MSILFMAHPPVAHDRIHFQGLGIVMRILSFATVCIWILFGLAACEQRDGAIAGSAPSKLAPMTRSAIAGPPALPRYAASSVSKASGIDP